MNPQFSTTRVEVSAPEASGSLLVAPASQAYQEHFIVGERQNIVEFHPVQEQVTIQEIPEIQVVERMQEQIEKQIKPERSEEQIGDFPIPRITAAHAAPSPVNECVTPTPVVNHTAPAPVMKDTTLASVVAYETPIPLIEHVTPTPVVNLTAPAPVMKDTTLASVVAYETPIPVIEHVTPAPVNPVIKYVPESVKHEQQHVVGQIVEQSQTHVPNFDVCDSLAFLDRVHTEQMVFQKPIQRTSSSSRVFAHVTTIPFANGNQ